MNPKYKRLPSKTRAFLDTFVSSLKTGYRLMIFFESHWKEFLAELDGCACAEFPASTAGLVKFSDFTADKRFSSFS
jgi:hypothetical protein